MIMHVPELPLALSKSLVAGLLFSFDDDSPRRHVAGRQDFQKRSRPRQAFQKKLGRMQPLYIVQGGKYEGKEQEGGEECG